MAGTNLTRDELIPFTVRVPVAARMLGIGKTKLYELIAQNEIEVIKLGSATLIIVASIQAFIERQRASAMATAITQKRRGRPRTCFAQLSSSKRT